MGGTDRPRRPGPASAGAGRYVVGEVRPFDQKNQMFMRATWDPEWLPTARRYYGYRELKTTEGYTIKESALNDAGWWVELAFSSGNFVGQEGLAAWDAEPVSSHRVARVTAPVPGEPAEFTRLVKRAARLYGASLVGTCLLDRRWLYSHSYHTLRKESRPIAIPDEFKWAIVMAHEMDFEGIRQAPNYIASAAASTVYSRMAVTAGLLAQYIRGLGYRALPLGNDTACSIPMAIDAGLGELSRAGWLITPEYGPRVRLNKVITNMPLVPDEPIEFGVWDFCLKCRKCARACPGRAIESGPPTDKPHNICNREGVDRWPVNAEKCFSFLASTGTDCGTCIRVCPFNKPGGVLHDVVKWTIKRFPPLNTLFIKADDVFGYGRAARPAEFWNDRKWRVRRAS
ncbi:MAG: reductive dehalogenase [Dehalococcoidia bacterium]|nr:reductive dehalogenase [Dehalococcoidia bacterium]